jgi:hypothetical protein
MRRKVAKPIVGFLVLMTCEPTTPAKQDVDARETKSLDRAIAFAVYLEAHANRLEGRSDVCVGVSRGAGSR